MRLIPVFLIVGLSACGSAAAPDGAEGASATDRSQPPLAFVQCGTCHQTKPGRNGIGPSLAGVFGAKAGHVGDYAYSAAMRGSGLTWDEATLDTFLANPRAAVPGTKMSYAGLRDEGQRAEIIEFLKTQ